MGAYCVLCYLFECHGMIIFLFHSHNTWHLPIFNILVIVWLLFSELEAATHVTVVAVLMSYPSSPPGYFGGWFNTYCPLFVLSLLLQLVFVNFSAFLAF